MFFVLWNIFLFLVYPQILIHGKRYSELWWQNFGSDALNKHRQHDLCNQRNFNFCSVLKNFLREWQRFAWMKRRIAMAWLFLFQSALIHGLVRPHYDLYIKQRVGWFLKFVTIFLFHRYIDTGSIGFYNIGHL